MAKEKLLLINLNEEKTKKISEIISSNTSRKILDYLADKDDTEANISKNIKLPISTVHYHIQKLMQARLVVVDEFHYSKKGREVNHYKLANKYIIIAPKKISGIKQALKNVLPVGIIVLGLSAIIKFISGGFGVTKAAAPQALMKTEEAAYGAERLMDEAIATGTTAAAEGAADAGTAAAAEGIAEITSPAMETAADAAADEAVTQIVEITPEPLIEATTSPDIALWFLIGGAAAILVYLLVMLIKSWKK